MFDNVLKYRTLGGQDDYASIQIATCEYLCSSYVANPQGEPGPSGVQGLTGKMGDDVRTVLSLHTLSLESLKLFF